MLKIKKIVMLQAEIKENGVVELLNTEKIDNGNVSDGYHTFDELYHHRMVLFSVICNTYKNIAWKSKLHHDGTMYENYFIVGIDTPKGQYSYHYHMDNWKKFDVRILENAPVWDGHTPGDIERLCSLLDDTDSLCYGCNYFVDGYCRTEEICTGGHLNKNIEKEGM